jgi:hypothetical protein
MDMAFYDQMAIEDQRDYLKYLVRTTEQLLTEQGQPDLAKRVALLFKASGSQVSVGERLFQEGIEFDKTYRVEHPDRLYPLHAENALLYALVKSRLTNSLPDTFFRRLREKPFWAKRPLRTN